MQITCFTSTRVQMLPLKLVEQAIFIFYFYLLALLVHECKC